MYKLWKAIGRDATCVEGGKLRILLYLLFWNGEGKIEIDWFREEERDQLITCPFCSREYSGTTKCPQCGKREYEDVN